MALAGAFKAQLKNGKYYYRSSVTYKNKHISLGSYDTEDQAHNAYRVAKEIIRNKSITIDAYRTDTALDFDKFVYKHLQKVENNPVVFGRQYCVDKDERVLYEDPYLLINATDIAFDDVEKPVKSRGGIAIPAHLDKSTTSLISSLGYVPPESTFKVFELKNMSSLHALREAHPYLRDCRVITDSDAHYLEHINEAVNFLEVEEKSVAGVIKALGSGN